MGYLIEVDGHRLSDAEHVQHVAEVKYRLADGRAARLDSHFRHTLDDRHEIWTAERSAAHDALLDDLYGRASSVPCEHKAVMAGGLPGAGKTTVLTRYADIDLSKYLVVDPDIIKEEMAWRGLVPDIAGLSPMEATEFVHEESSVLAKRLATRVRADGRDIIWDFTMCNIETTSKRIESLQASGYAAVHGIFVAVGIDDSVKRADARHREGHEQYRAGQGLGGRFTPDELIRAQADPDWGSRSRANFEQLKYRFGAWSVYDNSGAAPVLIVVHGPREDRKERAG
jgi:predicted ABC-type ATPase